ncbi:hypothetical protein T11_10529 [Trichinella zimbabwensis]|uniref:Uncharacterized protein n=1 Tax=Trichinella zimbabwensis TaxID=268475 RepID=A0A0V1H524_9BILA|nr:hypothetical protein T11_10529 [Trichinella zimbabwensis]
MWVYSETSWLACGGHFNNQVLRPYMAMFMIFKLSLCAITSCCYWKIRLFHLRHRDAGDEQITTLI